MADHPRDECPPTTVVYLADGRAIDITGLTPIEAVECLIRLGVNFAEISRTVHHVRERIDGATHG